MNRPELSLILPCYNESSHFKRSIEHILTTISFFSFPIELIFVDDGSSDSTPKLIQALCKSDRRCRCVFHSENTGRGAAVASGISVARAPITAYMDIDCEVSPIYLPLLLTTMKANHLDIVVGKRIYRTGFGSILREIASVGYRLVVTTLLSTGGVDTESGYKAFRMASFRKVLPKIQNQQWFWDTESIVRAADEGLHVGEVPVLFLRDQTKQSSVHLIRDTIEYIRAIVRFKMSH